MAAPEAILRKLVHSDFSTRDKNSGLSFPRDMLYCEVGDRRSVQNLQRLDKKTDSNQCILPNGLS
jgi:hypothetical protein